MNFPRIAEFEVVVGGEVVAVRLERDGAVIARSYVIGSVTREVARKCARRFVARTADGREVSAGCTAERTAVALAYRVLRG